MSARQGYVTAVLGVLLAASVACQQGEHSSDNAKDGALGAEGADGELRTPPILQEFAFGGDFELVDHRGETFRLGDHRGEIFVMFFGYTACPDFCPQTLSLLGRAYEQVGPGSDQVTTLFVSLDPQRDTPDQLAAYLGYFDIKALGLTGPKQAIDQLVTQFAGRYEVEQPDTESAPLFAHTTFIYLIDQRGKVRYTFRPNDTPRFIAAGIEQLLDG